MTTWKEEQAITRLELLDSAKAVVRNSEAMGDVVGVCFAQAVSTYLQAELDCEAQGEVRTLPPFDATLDHDGETQPGIAAVVSDPFGFNEKLARSYATELACEDGIVPSWKL